MATKFKLIQKAISGNWQSLFLDFYPLLQNTEMGETTQMEFLNLFLYNETKNE
ncbi:hypothetical protein BH11BAC4_BH11BAC4_06790 [soil metagenome]